MCYTNTSLSLGRAFSKICKYSIVLYLLGWVQLITLQFNYNYLPWKGSLFFCSPTQLKEGWKIVWSSINDLLTRNSAFKMPIFTRVRTVTSVTGGK